MGTMKTFNAKDWTPALLVAPDGRTYTPGDHAEHRELLTRGYVVAPAEPEPVPEPAPTETQSGPTTVGEPEPTPSETAPEPTPSPAGETKPKTNRRNGGAL
ncbi:hypothetical protein [Williamsia sp.]|uniref:hypothetical protein n=1 Tax=Williamsia sp. TaxID=1872085 RepID=UPI002F948527